MSAPFHPSTCTPDTTALPFSSLVLECLTALRYHSADLKAYLSEVVSGINRLSQSDWTIVTLRDGETGQIMASSLDINLEDMAFSIHGTLAGEVFRSRQLLIIEDSRQSPKHLQLPQGYLSCLGVPLTTIKQEVIGTICSLFKHPHTFLESEIKIVELFAERAATTVENYRLYQEQERFNKQLSQDIVTCSINLKKAQKSLIERERLAAIGEFTAMIVHEIRNPLTTVKMGLDHAQKVLQSERDQRRLALAISEAHRLQHLLCEILSYAKPQALRLSKLNISQFFQIFLKQIRAFPEGADRNIQYAEECPDFEVMADADKLKQVFLNLFRNACEATASDDLITFEITAAETPAYICIQIHNGGDPIPPELLPRIMEPFCSAKPCGTGLGLAISKRIILAHGGTLGITSSDMGTTVSVYLPLEKFAKS
ncbi:MAG: ATP-binding protein [Leptolyngbyaceae bacterium]|nr:ATP-binding protein [Leptolyngbyaceae bacterium]